MSARNDSNDYVIRTFDSPDGIAAAAWNELLAHDASAMAASSSGPTPFLRHEYLAALHDSGSASPASGWTPRFVTLWKRGELHAACPMYLKDHSWGEYVFDWAWASAYERHGMAYYPKAVVAVPFTPVPGPRLLARDEAARTALVRAALAQCRRDKVSSLHLLFLAEEDAKACARENLMLRHTLQFHWTNEGWATFDEFLASLSHDKRKKIRQERRKVEQAGVSFRAARGNAIAGEDWDFFYRCYERTYLEHGNAPYLSGSFFAQVARTMPGNWLLFIAERGGRPIASSLIAVEGDTAYGRYWGAVERVDCLHFEACFYQPLAWCIANGLHRFEGGAQGEHKMARALMPVKTTSAHWLANPDFAFAVERFLEREGQGVDDYLGHLGEHSPFRQR